MGVRIYPVTEYQCKYGNILSRATEFIDMLDKYEVDYIEFQNSTGSPSGDIEISIKEVKSLLPKLKFSNDDYEKHMADYIEKMLDFQYVKDYECIRLGYF